MFQYRGFLAEAAREAATAATAVAQKKADKAAERAAKKVQKELDKLAKELKAIQLRTLAFQEETKKIKQEGEAVERNSWRFQSRSIVMKCWAKGIDIDYIAYITDVPHYEVCQLIMAFENIEVQYNSKNNVNINKLVKISGLTEYEVKTLLMLLEKK